MTTYRNLLARFENLKAKEAAYWEGLRTVLDDVIDKVFECLAMDEGTKGRLRLGCLNEQNVFCPATLSELPQRFRHIEFALELTLSDQESVIPPSKIITVAKLEGDQEEGFTLLSSDGREKLQSFNQAADLLIKGFSKKLDSFDPAKRKDLR